MVRSFISFALFGLTDLFVAIFVVLPTINTIYDSLMVTGYLIAKFIMQWQRWVIDPTHPIGKAFYIGTDAFTAWFLYANTAELGGLAGSFVPVYIFRIIITTLNIML